MNDIQELDTEAQPRSTFEFTGTWREFLPIALTNLLLMIVTLGIYRFWATARTRRYLWSRTRFLDDHLEWTGTGKEMFLGFLIVFFVVAPLLIGLQLFIQAMVLRQQMALAALTGFIFYGGIVYLIGVATFRALRYRLSRTWWHGIRGGSDEGGWRFGFSYAWRMAVGWLLLTLLVPWAMTRLWNERWSRMSFGQYSFEPRARTGGLFLRWLGIVLVPVGVLVLLGLLMQAYGLATDGAPPSPENLPLILTISLGLISIYVSFLLASLAYYAAYYRQVVRATSWGGLEFAFTARTRDWLKLILGNIALVIVTLGIGILFIGYRNWSFAVRHLKARGEFDYAALAQSGVAAPRDAEGLADAFDIGAI